MRTDRRNDDNERRSSTQRKFCLIFRPQTGAALPESGHERAPHCMVECFNVFVCTCGLGQGYVAINCKHINTDAEKCTQITPVTALTLPTITARNRLLMSKRHSCSAVGGKWCKEGLKVDMVRLKEQDNKEDRSQLKVKLIKLSWTPVQSFLGSQLPNFLFPKTINGKYLCEDVQSYRP